MATAPTIEPLTQAQRKSARRSIPKEVWPVIKRAEKQGWVLANTGGNHPYELVLSHARIPLATSPTDAIAMRNMIGQRMRRAVIDLRSRGLL